MPKISRKAQIQKVLIQKVLNPDSLSYHRNNAYTARWYSSRAANQQLTARILRQLVHTLFPEATIYDAGYQKFQLPGHQDHSFFYVTFWF